MKNIPAAPGIPPRMYLLAVCWGLVNSWFLWKEGIVVTGEAEKYIREAHHLLSHGTLSSPNFWMYSTQILLISLALKGSLGFGFVIFLQLLLNALSLVAFLRLVAKYFPGDPKIQGLAGFLMLLNLAYQEFNCMLQTESLFFSLTLLYASYLLRISKLTFKNFLSILGILSILFFTRPTGILLIPPTVVYLLVRNYQKWSLRIKIWGTLILGGIFIWLLNHAMSSGGELNFLLPFQMNSTVCGVPGPPLPSPLKLPATSNSLVSMLDFVSSNFDLFIRLAFSKTLAFFGLWRSYFHPAHNAYLMGFFFPLYLLVAASGKFWAKYFPADFSFLAMFLAVTWISVLLTCDDWHNRFFLSLSPLLILLALPALRKWIAAFRGKP